MQTGETRIRSKAMPPPNTNPMELDHVRVHVSNPFSRLSMVRRVTSRTGAKVVESAGIVRVKVSYKMIPQECSQ